MNSVKSNIRSLKYRRFTTPGSKDIEVQIFEFVAKAQFLYVFEKPLKKDVLNNMFYMVIFQTYFVILNLFCLMSLP